MKAVPRTKPRAPDRTALDLIEEATHTLRAAPAAAWACYFTGTVPFILALVYFWADMSLSPFARGHDVEAALGLAALYMWMKCWQNAFAQRIRAQIALEEPAPWTLARAGRVLLAQAAVQPFGLLVLVPPLAFLWKETSSFNSIFALFPPLGLLLLMLATMVSALVLALPVAFFHNAGVLDDGRGETLRELIKRAGRLAGLWPRQNIFALIFLALFGTLVFVTWLTVFYLVPQYAHMLLGIESTFSRAGLALIFNSTFLAANLGLAYLSVHPLAMTLYVLRCFYGEARHSGEDLKARLKAVTANAKTGAMLAAVVLLLALPCTLRAADASPPAATPPPTAPSAPPTVAPDQLDHSINDVIHQDKYAWRTPGEKNADDQDEGVIARFFDHIHDMLAKWFSKVKDWLWNIYQKLFPDRAMASSGGFGFAGISGAQALLFGLAALVAGGLAIYLYRYFQNRKRRIPSTQAQPLATAPDLTDENTGADALPEDGWARLARELLERGEYRLALRAYYLSGLANLAGRNLISLAKFKSNRDYERELRRRGHAFPQLPPLFNGLVLDFERVWYGRYETGPDHVAGFRAQIDQLRGGAA